MLKKEPSLSDLYTQTAEEYYEGFSSIEDEELDMEATIVPDWIKEQLDEEASILISMVKD